MEAAKARIRPKGVIDHHSGPEIGREGAAGSPPRRPSPTEEEAQQKEACGEVERSANLRPHLEVAALSDPFYNTFMQIYFLGRGEQPCNEVWKGD